MTKKKAFTEMDVKFILTHLYTNKKIYYVILLQHP